MRLGYRTIRAAGAALLVAAAAGAGGTTGLTSALGADPATVRLAGTVVDGTGLPFPRLALVIQEEQSTDGGLAAFQVTTRDDGSFAADLYPWGTIEAPARISIRTTADAVRLAGACTQEWGVATTLDLPLAQAAAEPVTITATLLGEVCGTTATPGGTTAKGGGATLTPPPTDLPERRVTPAVDRIVPLLTVGFVAGLLVAILLVVPRPGARRRG